MYIHTQGELYNILGLFLFSELSWCLNQGFCQANSGLVSCNMSIRIASLSGGNVENPQGQQQLHCCRTDAGSFMQSCQSGSDPSIT
jgi:hypothetical protein